MKFSALKHPVRTFLLSTVMVFASLSAQASGDKALKIATGELPPYATASRPDAGIALGIVRRAFEIAGYKIDFAFQPWSRTLAETRLGQWDGTAHWGHKPEHDASFLLSDNILTEQWVFVYRKDIDFQWNTLEDLSKYRLALIQDYTYTPEIWAMATAGKFKYDKLPNDQAALKMLLLGRVDVVPMERNVVCDLLKAHHSEAEAARLVAHPKLMTDSFTTHLMLPRSKTESAARLTEFNAGLKKLRLSGEYAKLLAKVSCPASWTVPANK